MTKTIKIIDILNLIANEEWDKLPKKIKYDYSTYELIDNKYWTTNGMLLNILPFSDILNNEVEIIEEQPKTIKKIKIEDIDNKFQSEINPILIDKINWLIDKVKEKE